MYGVTVWLASSPLFLLAPGSIAADSATIRERIEGLLVLAETISSPDLKPMQYTDGR